MGDPKGKQTGSAIDWCAHAGGASHAAIASHSALACPSLVPAIDRNDTTVDGKARADLQGWLSKDSRPAAACAPRPPVVPPRHCPAASSRLLAPTRSIQSIHPFCRLEVCFVAATSAGEHPVGTNRLLDAAASCSAVQATPQQQAPCHCGFAAPSRLARGRPGVGGRAERDCHEGIDRPRGSR